MRVGWGVGVRMEEWMEISAGGVGVVVPLPPIPFPQHPSHFHCNHPRLHCIHPNSTASIPTPLDPSQLHCIHPNSTGSIPIPNKPDGSFGKPNHRQFSSQFSMPNLTHPTRSATHSTASGSSERLAPPIGLGGVQRCPTTDIFTKGPDWQQSVANSQ